MIFGHQKNLKIFSRMIAENRFPHGVLFAGPEGVGKKKTAIEIAKFLEGEHKGNFFDFAKKDCDCSSCALIENGKFPDIFEMKQEGKQIPIKSVREVRSRISLSTPYKFKIVIIDGAETLSREATGALLKVLEEPRGKTIFFFLTSMQNILPQTILSRVEIFKFYPLTKKEIEKNLDQLLPSSFNSSQTPNREEIIDLSLGKIGRAKELALDKSKILYYNSILEEIKKIGKMPVFDRFKEAEKIEKSGKINDFLLLGKLWFRDLLFCKKGIALSHFSFSFLKDEIKKESQNFSEEKLKKIILKIEEMKKYLNFSNINKLLAIENLLLEI